MKKDTDETPQSHVLVVDDEPSICFSVSELLKHAGFAADSAADAPTALTQLKDRAFDVVVSDIILPRVSGVDLLKQIKDAAPHVPVIMMTGEPNVETASIAVRAGAADYLVKPVDKATLVKAVTRAADSKRIHDENRRLTEENRVYQENLEQLVEQRTTELHEALEGAILAMSSAVESRDPYTAGHEQRVACLARAIAQDMNLPASTVAATYYAAMVHDVGKISIPAEILSHPGRLCKESMGLVRKHSASGSHILEKVKFPWPIAKIVLQHHERMDGSGYPQGLKGEAICMEARIVAVADVVEAMASHRPYRPALGSEAAMKEIAEGRGSRYDADVCDACLRLFREKGFTFETATS